MKSIWRVYRRGHLYRVGRRCWYGMQWKRQGLSPWDTREQQRAQDEARRNNNYDQEQAIYQNEQWLPVSASELKG